ncbi:ATP-binding protein [Sorangium sp. So ce1128]
MKEPYDLPPVELDEHLARVLGLGEGSVRKNYYPELRARIAELERFRAALDESGDAILLADLPDGRLRDANKTACQMLGLSSSELLGRSLGELVPALGDSLARTGGRADRLGETVEVTVRIAHGGEVPIWANMTPVRVADGHYAAVVMHDLTEKKRADAERELLLESERAARADAERASRLKDEFVSTISHELRTPLNAIHGWTAILRRRGISAEQLAKGLEVIARNTGLLAQLVDDLLDVSRIAAGKLSLEFTPLDLAPVVDAAVNDLRASADAKGVTLRTSLTPYGAPVVGNTGRLQQVVSNLVSNAIKFTPKGGCVDVTLTREGARVVLDVRDTGQGIVPEFLPHIFDRFRQADASVARHHGGLGLGLAIVKHVVERHGGKIRAESTGPGAGARFIVELSADLARRRAHDAASSTRWEPMDLTGTRVLVVEDDVDSRDLVQRVLAEHGADVHVTASGSESLEWLVDHPIDVLVSDISMPGMDGYELMRQVRGGRAPLAAAAPAIAMTAFARSEDRESALGAGFQEHLAKPIDPAALVSVVARLAKREPLVSP